MNRFAGMSLRTAVDTLLNLKAQAVEAAMNAATCNTSHDHAKARNVEDELANATDEFFQAFDPDQITEV
jgi:hypothetical protein